MSVNKLIKFYILEPEACLNTPIFSKNISDSICYQIFKSAFPQDDFYSIEVDKRSLFLDIKTYSKTHIFGTCSIKETFRPTSFIQQRNKETLETQPFTNLNSETQLEAYTFFYIDFNTNRMAAIANKKIPKIHEILMHAIWEKSKNLSRISIMPELIQDIEKEATKLLNPSWFEVEFATPPSAKDIPKMNVLLDEPTFKAKKYQIRIRIEQSDKTIVSKIMGLRKQKDTEHISALKLIGKNEMGLDETFNFIEALYVKTVPLELTDDTAANYAYIENSLKENLDKHVLEFT